MRMWPGLRSCALTLSVAIAPAVASAQTPASAPTPPAQRPFMVFGAAMENKATGIVQCGTSIYCDDVRVWRPTLIVGAGVPVTGHLSLEASIEWPTTPAKSEVAWRWSYTAPVTNNIASHRDVPILALARWEPGCRGGVCIEPVAGLGVAIHHSSNVIVSECGSVGVPLPCTTPSPSTRTPGSDTEDSLKFAWAIGLNLRVRLADRIWLQPTARLTFVGDGNDLFAGNPRGPETGSPFLGTFGLAIMVR